MGLMGALDAGTIPAGLHAGVERQLGVADCCHQNGQTQMAAVHLGKALRLLFHPALQGGTGGEKPWFLSPKEHLAAFHHSQLLSDLRAADARAAHALPRRPLPTPTRVGIIGRRHWAFVDSLQDELAAQPGLDIRRIDLDDILAPNELPDLFTLTRLAAEQAHGAPRPSLPAALAHAIDDCDVLWVEWGHLPAAWLSRHDLGDRALVVRLHRYEALAPYLQLLDMERVDRMVFIAPHVRTLVASLLDRPQLLQADVIANRLNAEIPDDVQGDRDSSVLQVQWAPAVKDVEWVLDVFEHARQQVPDLRLVLAGKPIPDDDPRAERIRARLDALGEAVLMPGFVSDMGALYRQCSMIVSGSLQEGSQESIDEAALHGCIPVVRDWPHVAAPGPRGLFPEQWVVGSQDAAVQRIVEIERDLSEQECQSLREDTARSTRQRRDPHTVVDALAHLLRTANSRETSEGDAP